MTATTALVVPLRAFALGKERLATELEPDERAALARALAETVLDAAAAMPVAVVTSAPEVLTWARARGATTLGDPGSLDAAASAGRDWARTQGFRRVVVAHADLPYARSFAGVAVHGGVGVATLVPDHRDDGTPVLSVPTAAPFEFAYGPGSFRRHAALAHEAGLAVRVLRDPALGFDVDVPADLDELGVRAG